MVDFRLSTVEVKVGLALAASRSSWSGTTGRVRLQRKLGWRGTFVTDVSIGGKSLRVRRDPMIARPSASGMAFGRETGQP